MPGWLPRWGNNGGNLSRVNGTRRPQPDLVFDDEWTDSAPASPGASINLVWRRPFNSLSPMSSACASEWSSICRVVINYETHIHPLRSVDRRV